MEMPYHRPTRSPRWRLAGIVGFFLAIAALPVAFAYWPIEHARWLLAAAENVVEKSEKNGDTWRQQAAVLLDRAKVSHPDIENSLEYARISYFVQPDVVERAIKLIQSLPAARQPHAANVLSELRYKAMEFNAAYQILVAGYPGPDARTNNERNQLAYFSALANRDLPSALVDIEKAIAESTDLKPLEMATYLDTKAWVLFRLKRYDEALIAIDQTIKATDKGTAETAFVPGVKVIIQAFLKGQSPFTRRALDDNSDPFSTLLPDLADFLKSFAVYRYHRAEILEGLGRVDEADKEYDWLQDRGFNDFNRLY